jgi:hypothetical protein
MIPVYADNDRTDRQTDQPRGEPYGLLLRCADPCHFGLVATLQPTFVNLHDPFIIAILWGILLHVYIVGLARMAVLGDKRV